MIKMDSLADVVVAWIFCVILAMLAISTCYMPSILRARIEVDRAKAKALSGLDLRDAETRRTIRALLGEEEVEK